VQETNALSFGPDEELDLFAEEMPEEQKHNLPPNSISTFDCACGLSTFYCYGNSN
jgi:hypothetical protein